MEKELPGELRQKVSNLQGSLQGVLGENVDAEEEDGPPLLAGVFQLTGTIPGMLAFLKILMLNGRTSWHGVGGKQLASWHQ